MRLASVGVIIPAAGQGARMGAAVNKQFLSLNGIPILAHTIKVFNQSPLVDEIVVVGARQDIEPIRELVRGYQFEKVAATPVGGAERQESVLAGLKALSETIQTVVVHDGARPLLTLEQLHRFLSEAAENTAAIMAVPVKDTIKRVDPEGLVLETPQRGTLRAVQTPQVFKRTILEEIHRKAAAAGFRGTDDAALLEWAGYPVQVLAGAEENIKITTRQDLWLAEQIIANRRSELVPQKLEPLPLVEVGVSRLDQEG